MPVGAEPTRAEEEASLWLVLLDAPGVPQSEIARFQAWLAASEENKTAWAAVSDTWDELGPALAAMPRETLAALPGSVRSLRGGVASRRRILAIAGGATLAATATTLAFLPLGESSHLPAGARSYSTPTRASRVIVLEDGSIVELSPMARLLVGFTPTERRVEVTEGAALFTVHNDANRPFIITTRYGEVTTLVGALAVRVLDASASATVLSGLVHAEAALGQTALERLRARPRPLTLKANQEISFKPHSMSAATLTAADLKARLAWRDGAVALEGQPLREAASEITRFSGVVFVFADRRTASVPVTGYLRGDDVEGFLALLRLNCDVEAERRVDGVVVLRRQH